MTRGMTGGMTGLLILVNRGFYGLLGLTLIVLVAVPMSSWLERKTEIELLPLPDAPIPEAAEHPEIAHPDPASPPRNPFDPDGKPWRVEDEKPQVKIQPVAAQARGVMLLPGVAGLLTDKEFVKTGQNWQDGQLKGVGGGFYVLSSPDGDQTILLDAERQNRIKELLKPPPAKKPGQNR